MPTFPVQGMKEDRAVLHSHCEHATGYKSTAGSVLQQCMEGDAWIEHLHQQNSLNKQHIHSKMQTQQENLDEACAGMLSTCNISMVVCVAIPGLMIPEISTPEHHNTRTKWIVTRVFLRFLEPHAYSAHTSKASVCPRAKGLGWWGP